MTDVTRSLTIKAQTQGASKAKSDLKGVADASNEAATSMDQFNKATNASGDAQGRAARSFLNLERAAQAQAARLDLVTRAQPHENKGIYACAESIRG